MNTAAATKQTTATAPAIYECSVPGCVEPTTGHYCAGHRVDCDSCGVEYCEAELLRGLCCWCGVAASNVDGYEPVGGDL